MHFLFFSRLFLYFLAVSIPAFHPAVAVPYDRTGILAWFFLIPAQMIFAFYIKPPRFRFWTGALISAASVIGFALTHISFPFEFFSLSGWRQAAFFFSFAAFLSYVWTKLVFGSSGRGIALAGLEMFALGGVYYKILDFTRASEEVSRESSTWTVVLLVVAVIAFLLHGVILYLAAFPDLSREKKRRELVWLAVFAVPVLLVLAIALPADFVKHIPVVNGFNDEPPPTPRDLSMEGEPQDRGGKGEKEQEDHNRNGLPLGDREEKYPSELQGGGNQRQEVKPNQELPDEHRGGSRSGDGQQGGQQGNEGQENQGQQGDQERQDQGGQSSRGRSRGRPNQKLEGVPSDQWDNMQQSGGSGGKQMAVMVIASPVSPVYAAEAYWDEFDPEAGLSMAKDDRLNRLTHARFLETWRDTETVTDKKRQPYPIFYLSTIENRVLAYRPKSIEPTVMDRKYHPFDLSYTAVSLINVSTPEDWRRISGLSPEEKKEYERYLRVDLAARYRIRFNNFVQTALAGKRGYFEKIEAVLKSLKGHRYELGYDEDTKIPKLDTFLFQTKTGDCTEFSHTVAILARIAGIPSRVVTGYLAARDMQTPYHRGGVRQLRRSIPLLQKFPMEDLYLVTTSHHHAWVQLYLPDYGWIDFESTAFAIPPKPEMDPNNQDVVIPLIEERANPQKKPFPWRFVLKILGMVAAFFVAGLYGYRIGRVLVLKIKSRGETPEALRALFTLLFIRLAAEGYPLKERHLTALEFSRKLQDLKEFAALYTMLRYREIYPEGEKRRAWQDLRKIHTQTVQKIKKPGIYAFFRRIFTLRPIYY